MTAAAKALSATQQAWNNLVNGKSGISPEKDGQLEKRLAEAQVFGYACRWITISRAKMQASSIEVKHLVTGTQNCR